MHSSQGHISISVASSRQKFVFKIVLKSLSIILSFTHIVVVHQHMIVFKQYLTYVVSILHQLFPMSHIDLTLDCIPHDSFTVINCTRFKHAKLLCH